MSRRVEMFENTGFPSKVIRNIRDPILKGNGWSEGQPKNSIELQQKFSIAKYEFDKLRNFGVKVPQFEYSFGFDKKGEQQLFVIVDRVDGYNPLEENIKPEDKPLLLSPYDQTLSGIAQYILHAYNTKEPYLGDLIKLEQCMYGSIRSGDKSIYFVDVDPSMKFQGMDDNTFKENVDSLIEECFCLENAFKGISMPKARASMSQLLAACLTNPDFFKNVSDPQIFISTVSSFDL